jgi:hypothetical protein
MYASHSIDQRAAAKNTATVKTAKGMRMMANMKNVMNGAQHPGHR